MDRNEDVKLVSCCVMLEGWYAVAEVGLNCREGQLNGVVVWGVWGEEFTSHAPECF